MDQHLADRLQSCPSLPTLPPVALEVLRLCQQNEEIDLGQIATAVSRDPAIAAKLLRLANSASFATRGKVTTLSRAVALVGTNATLSVTLSFSLVRARRRGDAGFDHAAFWRRALFSALAGRAMSEVGGLDPEETFLACLLQDLGMLALHEVFDGRYGALVEDAGGDHARLAELELAQLGGDHAEVTHLLARRWNLPEVFQAAALASHAPVPALQDGRRRRMLEAVFLSGRLADIWVAPGPGHGARQALELAERQLLIAPEVVGGVLSRMALAVPEAAADFELDLGGPDRIQAILEEARCVLRERIRSPAPRWRDADADDPGPEAARRALAAALGDPLAGQAPHAVLLVRPDREAKAQDLRALLFGCIRQADLLGWHGEAHLVILFDTPLAGALVAAERVRGRAAAAGMPCALGLALHAPGDPPGDATALLARAERALARARAAGGDRVVPDEPDPPPDSSPGPRRASGRPGTG